MFCDLGSQDVKRIIPDSQCYAMPHFVSLIGTTTDLAGERFRKPGCIMLISLKCLSEQTGNSRWKITSEFILNFQAPHLSPLKSLLFDWPFEGETQEIELACISAANLVGVPMLQTKRHIDFASNGTQTVNRSKIVMPTQLLFA